MSVAVTHLSKKFETQGQRAVPALRDVSLEVKTGELVALLGPSGSGKTTLLRIIAGLEIADGGRVLFAEDDVTEKSAYERKAGFVFQSYALFQHMSVFENIAFGLRVLPRRKRPDAAAITKRVTELLKLIQLEGYEKRLPAQLSGGQRQRVALARALAIEPRVLLLDEPFGALDAKVRKDLRKWLRHFHDQTHLTTLFVTHDQDEAFELADRVVIFNLGQIQQSGTPAELRENPVNDFVREFLEV
jgi:sulfate transport system ATP-binding protein